MQYQKTLVMAGLAAASMLGGAVGGMLVGGAVAAQGAQVVTATQVNLVDSSGQLRAVLAGRDERGMASLSFYDEAGQVRGILGIEDGGAPVLRLLTTQGQSRVQAFVENEDAFVVVGDEAGNSALFGAVGDTPMLSLGDGQRVRARMQLGPDGTPAIGLFDNEARRSMTLETDNVGAPFITLYEAGRPRTTIGITQQTAVLNMSDTQGTRLVIGVAENGRPSISFLNENGEVIQEFPTMPDQELPIPE